MSEREEIIDLIWGDESYIESISLEAAADRLIAAGYQKVPEGFEWHEIRMHGYLSAGDILVTGPLFEFEKAQAREYRQMIGTTPWKPVEDDDK